MTAASAVSNAKTTDRYFFVPKNAKPEAISNEPARKLKFYAGGRWLESKTAKYMPCHNPSTGAVIAYAPQCTADEVEEAIQAAVKAFSAWRDTPVTKRTRCSSA